MKKTTASIVTMACVFAVLGFVAGSPRISMADIYRWQDDSGVVHFTDTPSNIPEKYRPRKKMIQEGPPEAGRPSLSTVGAPPSRPSPPPVPPMEPAPRPEDSPAKGEQLRARIEAKERFIEGVDRKRSRAVNPLGNKFVSPEDLELYRKYSEELPQDRRQLEEIRSAP